MDTLYLLSSYLHLSKKPNTDTDDSSPTHYPLTNQDPESNSPGNCMFGNVTQKLLYIILNISCSVLHLCYNEQNINGEIYVTLSKPFMRHGHLGFIQERVADLTFLLHYPAILAITHVIIGVQWHFTFLLDVQRAVMSIFWDFYVLENVK